MKRETFFDRWTPETPIKVTWSSDEPESYLSLADAGYRLARLSDGTMDSDTARRYLNEGRRLMTPFASYELVTGVTA